MPAPPLTCDGDIEPVWEHHGTPVNLGRTQRIVPRRIRRLIEHRDRGCRVPGCDQSYWLQIHHITHWEDNGETVTTNLICLCSTHHRLHHQGHLGIVGNADDPAGVVFTDRYGNHLHGATRARPPKATDMPHVDPYTGPTGERLDRTAVYFSRTPSPAAEPQPADDPDPTSAEGPPGRRRTGRCHTTGRPHTGTPDASRAPPAA